MKTIGFAGTFYTLWDVSSERVDVAEGAWYNKVTCTYYKNLSKDLNEAIEKAGTDNVDESLRGKRKSFFYKTALTIEPKIITDVERLFIILLRNDTSHLVEGVREAAFNQALQLGYLTEINGDIQKESFLMGQKAVNKAYRWNAKLRNEDLWRGGDGNYYIGII